MKTIEISDEAYEALQAERGRTEGGVYLENESDTILALVSLVGLLMKRNAEMGWQISPDRMGR